MTYQGLLWPVLGICALAACAPPADDQAQNAQAALDAFQFDKARAILAEALVDHPNNPALLEALARTRLKLGDGDGAIGALDRLKRVSGLPQDGPYLLAEAELQRGRVEAVQAQLQGIDTAEAWRLRAAAARADGQGGRAQQAFTTGAQRPGAKAHLLADYALLLLDYRRLDDARMLADRARQENPQLEQVLVAQGLIAQAERRDQDALAAFSALLATMPRHRVALKGMIQLLGGAGKVDALRPYVEQGNNAYPSDPDFLFFTARLAALDKHWGRVLSLFQAREGSIAYHHGAQALYGEALIELGQSQAAVQRLTVLHNQRPGDPAVRRLLARALHDVGEWQELALVLRPLVEEKNARTEDLALWRRAMTHAAPLE